jgi:uncharacterized cupredoxin-like copper-binding protein
MNSKALMLFRTTIASVSSAGLAAVGIPAQAALVPGSTQATRAAAVVTTTIRVTTFNSSFHLSAKTAPRGVVIFKVTNKAVFGHDFSINGHTTKVLKTGESTTLRVTFLKPGHYVYKDTVDHHVRWGDIGGFTIT